MWRAEPGRPDTVSIEGRGVLAAYDLAKQKTLFQVRTGSGPGRARDADGTDRLCDVRGR